MRSVLIGMLCAATGCLAEEVSSEERETEIEIEGAGDNLAAAGRGVINANLHPIVVNGSNCSAPDYAALGASPYTQANAFHVSVGNCRFDAAMTLSTYGKPRIVSDDAPQENGDAQGWITELCAAAANALGHYHFDHLDHELDDQAKEGAAIAGWSTFRPLTRAMLTWIDANGCASTLAQNGRLARDGATNKLIWNGARKTLLGFGFVGAVTAGDQRLAIDAYLGALASKGVNFTRVWAIDQWVGLAIDHPGGYLDDGLTPFIGDVQDNDINLEGPDPGFHDRLRRFAQAAADRGMVVQLTLFDKHGLITDDPARWPDSPYRAANNVNGFLWSNPSGGLPPQNFTTHTGLVEVHQAFIRRVVEEVGGIGNVMFEVMNEAKKAPGQVDWPNIEAWQGDIARQVTLALPAAVARDAFNGDNDGVALAGKAADAGGSWSAGNARIAATTDPVTQLRMGRVVSAETPNASSMSGSLPAVAAGRTAVSLRADVERDQGSIVLGFQDGASNRINIALAPPPPGSDPEVRGILQLRSVIGGVWTFLDQTEVRYDGATASLRLTIDLVHGVAEVALDGAVVMKGVPPLLPSFTRATFLASRESGTYLRTDGAIDNFQVDLRCTTPSCIGE